LKNSALDKLNKAQKEQHLTEIDQHYVEMVIDILNNEKDKAQIETELKKF
jgi:hypothetical protein